jgi:hypothetical protein
VTLNPHHSFVASFDLVTKPETTDAARADVHVVEAKLIRHLLRPLRRVLQRVVEDPLLDVGRYAIRVRCVAVVAHQLAGLRDVAKFLCELQQRQFPSGTLGCGGHSVLQGLVVATTPNYPDGPGVLRYAPSAACRTITGILQCDI